MTVIAPDANRAAQIEEATRIVSLVALGHAGHEDLVKSAVHLAALVISLDSRLKSGGELPYPWRANR